MAQQLCEDKSRDMASSTGFCYSDVSSANPTVQVQPHLMNHIQGFVTDPEMFNLTTGMEMIGFSKNLQQQSESNGVMWKSFFGKPSQHAGPSSSKTMNESSSSFYNPHEYNKQDFTSGISETSSENLIVGGAHDSAPWQENRLIVDDSSLRCVFPCEGNERPSQGLSLSLSSTNPSSIALQSFELRQSSHHQHQPDFVSSKEGFFGKSQQQQMLQDGYFSSNKAANFYQGQFLIKNSKFLVPAQDLLNEFCSLGTKENDVPKPKYSQKNKQWEEDNAGGSSKNHSLSSLEFVELQKRKTRLLSMLEEVDRRYKHYCNQMKAVVSSFEAVAGNGAATVYSALALKAMSRHFRCLKDGILDQIQATRKAMGEKDPVAPGTTRGETPRLRIIDQALRQQRAFQQINMMETHPWRPQRGLPERSVSVLRAWLFEHFLHPYPSDVDKHILARQTGLSRSQVSNWFINARVRLWKPMVEEMYLEEEKEQQNNIASSEGGTNHEEDQNQSPSTRPEDQKSTQASLLRIDSECVSSIINNPDHKNDTKSSKTIQNDHHMNPTDTFGSVELDFSSYTHHSSGTVPYTTNDHNANQSFHGGSGVSLTLGLQQHGAGGVSLAFPSATQNSLFYQRDQIEECQTVQYSLLDGEGQNMPYRNLMGTQLLHDLA
ncbi:homeobox protein BEL1 homolog [Abrus precatorius]|uniref:Homeobox protein BEL1 homolog n=1 Tax=Abrus precatorius TaxID=3816 RepID=A0A8B8K7K5_ABRPR|nr:homeobox protein BEL1 homolog [Abrus precatorius]XP_027339757.1 homeobox protein BEL1 homolog [Abrus precatorius]XP_027339758.1 homeobox protein BEL1 homolog [Abrus precatorius]